jgi:hypothetical protein
MLRHGESGHRVTTRPQGGSLLLTAGNGPGTTECASFRKKSSLFKRAHRARLAGAGLGYAGRHRIGNTPRRLLEDSLRDNGKHPSSEFLSSDLRPLSL